MCPPTGSGSRTISLARVYPRNRIPTPGQLDPAPPTRDHAAGDMDIPSRSAVATHSLVERCRHGDREAWRDLVEEYSRYVYAIIMRGYRLSESDAEDVFQDVFARVFERLETLRDDDARPAAPTSSTASSAATSPTARSPPSSTCRRARSRAGSAAASTGCARRSGEEIRLPPRLGGCEHGRA
jgi:hypothetical protein